MRTLDRPVPEATGHRPGPEVPMGQWPAQLFFAIEGVTYGSAWDDVGLTWDDPDNDPTWDQTGGDVVEYVDAICYLHGLTIDTGLPDPANRYTSAMLTASIDNHDGTWSRYGPAGGLAFFPPGHRVHVWAVIASEAHWLFSGRIATWAETEDRVDLIAFDAFSDTNVRIGEWTVGSAGDLPAERIAEILTTVAYPGTLKGDPGDIGLLARTTDNSPLEEMQAIAESDAGALFVDPDGQFVYTDRRWIDGRDDQPEPPVVFSQNVCDVDAVLWDLELRSDDENLVNRVTLTNDATAALTVTASDPTSEGAYGIYTLPENRSEDLWSTAIEGQAVADHIIEIRSEPKARIGQGALYLHDSRFDLWALGIDLRRGDLVRFVQDTLTQEREQFRLDLDLVVAGVRHEITPSTWVVTFGTTPTVGSREVPTWDVTGFTWDQVDPLNVWSH